MRAENPPFFFYFLRGTTGTTFSLNKNVPNAIITARMYFFLRINSVAATSEVIRNAELTVAELFRSQSKKSLPGLIL